MKQSRLSALIASLALGLSAVPALLAQPTVRQVDSDTLRVVDYRGKPPFERRYISRGAPDYARYEELLDYDPQSLFATSGGGGPPGKSLPSQRRRVSGDPGEVAEFARFEESTEEAEAPSPRTWCGAPGKSRPRLGSASC